MLIIVRLIVEAIAAPIIPYFGINSRLISKLIIQPTKVIFRMRPVLFFNKSISLEVYKVLFMNKPMIRSTKGMYAAM
jgi:hypothetical protein